MRLPTTALSNGIQRPLVMLHLKGSFGLSINVDALVDTGADVTLLSDSARSIWELTWHPRPSSQLARLLAP